jgi:hypothetical protein
VRCSAPRLPCGSPTAPLETAAEAIRLHGSQAGKKGAAPAGGLRDVRLALLALPRDPKSVPEIPQLEMSKTVEVLRNEADGADMMLTGLVLMRYLAQRPANQKNMSECNCVSLVLRSLHLHESNPTLQGVACGVSSLALSFSRSLALSHSRSLALRLVSESVCLYLCFVCVSCVCMCERASERACVLLWAIRTQRERERER